MTDPHLPLSEQMMTTITTLTLAWASYGIWMELASAETRPGNLNAMNEHSEFFRYDEEAHLRILTLELCMLHDRTKGTVALKGLVKLAGIPDREKADLLRKIEDLEPQVGKVKILRDKLFAHRSAAFKWRAVYKAAGLKRDDLQTLLERSTDIYNSLAKKLKAPLFSPNSFVRDDLSLMLRNIERKGSANVLLRN